MNSQRTALMWDTAIGFLGFFAVLSLIQAVLNLLRPEPALWPGFLAATLVLATWAVSRGKCRALAGAADK